MADLNANLSLIGEVYVLISFVNLMRLIDDSYCSNNINFYCFRFLHKQIYIKRKLCMIYKLTTFCQNIIWTTVIIKSLMTHDELTIK